MKDEENRLKREALVVKTNGKKATVMVLREEACASCSGRYFCGNVKKTNIEVINKIGAKVGDKVELEAESGALLAYTALLFLAPVVLAVGAYLIFSSFSAAAGYISLLIGFVLPYIAAFVIDRKFHARMPEICSVLIEEGAETEEFDECEKIR